jgi:hypothetical protein
MTLSKREAARLAAEEALVHAHFDVAAAAQAVTQLLQTSTRIWGLDLETGGLDPWQHRTRSIQIANDADVPLGLCQAWVGRNVRPTVIAHIPIFFQEEDS